MVVFAREKQKKLTTWEKKWLFHRSYWFFFIHLSYSRFSCVLVHKRPHKHTDKPHSVSSSYYSLRERETRRTLLKKSFSLLLGGCWRFFFTYIFNDVYVWFEGENYEALSLFVVYSWANRCAWKKRYWVRGWIAIFSPLFQLFNFSF